MRLRPRPRWFVPVAVLMADAVLLFGAVGVGLSIPSLRLLGGIGGTISLDYSTLLVGLPALRAAYLAEQLGVRVPGTVDAAGGEPVVTGSRDAEPVTARSPGVRSADGDDAGFVVDEHPLTNDDFADARPVRMGTRGYEADTSTEGAGREPGEPRASCETLGSRATVWYRFVAGSAMVVRANTVRTDLPVALAVYRGSTLDRLEELRCDGDPEGKAEVVFQARRGTAYHFQISMPVEGRLQFLVESLAPGRTELATMSSAGSQGNDHSWSPALSRNGRFVAFQSFASNLANGDTNECRWWLMEGGYRTTSPPNTGPPTASCPDIFLRDRRHGRTLPVSRAVHGEASNGASWSPAISADGRWVSFTSDATNLVSDTGAIGPTAATGRGSTCPAGTPEPWSVVCGNVYVWDRLRPSEPPALVSVSTAGQIGNLGSGMSALSADGRFVAFDSLATNLVPGDRNETWDIFLHDRDADGDRRFDERHAGGIRTVRVSVSNEGDEPAFGPVIGRYGAWYAGYSDYPAISADGRHIAFRSFAPNLVDGDTNRDADIFVRDVVRRTTVRVSIDSRARQTAGTTGIVVAISADGRRVAFSSEAPDLVDDGGGGAECPADHAGVDGVGSAPALRPCHQVFVHDRDWDGDGRFDERHAGAVRTMRVSVSSSGEPANAASGLPSISADGFLVAFQTPATNLAKRARGDLEAIYVHDLRTGRTEVVSSSPQGRAADGISQSPAISADGRHVAFTSSATNLVRRRDANGSNDIFVHSRPGRPR